MYQIIKKRLCDLIESCYKQTVDIKTLNKYRGFRLKIEEKELKSRLGKYVPKTKTIYLNNVRSEDNISSIVTLIHELSHHIDTVNRGISDHSKEFYNVHVDLLISAFDIGLLDYDDFLKTQSSARNINKIKKLVLARCYRPNRKNDNKKVWCIVTNSYEYNNFLKERGYIYNFYINGRMKLFEKENLGEEINELKEYCQNATICKYDGRSIPFHMKKSSNKEYEKVKCLGKCPQCGGKLIEKIGKYGRFIACSNYPECKYIEKKKSNIVESGHFCPECGKPLVFRNGKYGRFEACSGYPECRYIYKE